MQRSGFLIGLLLLLIARDSVRADFFPALDPYNHVGRPQTELPGVRVYSTVSERVVSNHVAVERVIVNDTAGRNDLFWVFGQFIDHDIVLTPTGNTPSPIQVPSGDPVFDPTGTGTATLPFTLTGRTPINAITPFIDGSAIYGVDATRLAAIRHPNPASGALRVSIGTLSESGVMLGANLLPRNTANLDVASGGRPKTSMFLAGDIRATEHVALSAMHTVWVRLHNYFDIQAQAENLSGDDAFARARNLTVAMQKRVTFGEYVPALLGDHWKCDLLPETPTAQDGITVDTPISFSVASYRFGHSMVSNDTTFDGHPTLTFGQLFFNPSVLRGAPSIEPFLRGLYKHNARACDNMVTDGLRNIPFAGRDLAAINIKRGRDTGVLPYNQIRVHFGFPQVAAFSDFITDPELLAAFETVYPEGPDVCDTWACGLAETPIGTSAMGELFTEMNRRQFCELKRMDPNHWEWSEGLSAEDRAQIRERDMHWVLCVTVGGSFCQYSSENAFFIDPSPGAGPVTFIFITTVVVVVLFAVVCWMLVRRG